MMKTNALLYKLLLLLAGFFFFLGARPFIAQQNCDRADTFIRLGFKKKAITQYRKALFLMPTFTYAYNQLASVYEEAGEIQNAIQTLETSFKYSPDNKNGFLILGALYAKNRHYDKAKIYLEKVLQFEPGNVIARAWLEVSNQAGQLK